MNFHAFITLIKDSFDGIMILLSIILAIFLAYSTVKNNFASVITNFIRDAEDHTELTNPEKMDLVISWIKNIIPRLFHVVFTEDILRQMAENVYQDMKKYRDTYIKNKTGYSTNKVIDIVNEYDKLESNNKEN